MHLRRKGAPNWLPTQMHHAPHTASSNQRGPTDRPSTGSSSELFFLSLSPLLSLRTDTAHQPTKRERENHCRETLSQKNWRDILQRLFLFQVTAGTKKTTTQLRASEDKRLLAKAGSSGRVTPVPNVFLFFFYNTQTTEKAYRRIRCTEIKAIYAFW
jgi:hypothetical protein